MATAKLEDITAKTLSDPGSVLWSQVAIAALQDIVINNLDGVGRRIFHKNKRQIHVSSHHNHHIPESRTDSQHEMNVAVRYAFLDTQLSSSISDATDPFTMSMFDEAAILTGGYAAQVNGKELRMSPADIMGIFESTLSRSIRVVGQFGLVVRVFRRLMAKRGKMMRKSATTESALKRWLTITALVTFGVFPSVASCAEYYIWATEDGRQEAKQERAERRPRMSKSRLEAFAYGDKKQEVILFGLKDWILSQWRTLALKEKFKKHHVDHPLLVALPLIKQTLESSFYVSLEAQLSSADTAQVFIASGSLRFPISVTEMETLRRSIQHVVFSTQYTNNEISKCIQAPFWLAAYYAAVDRTTSDTGDDYEAVRVPGGMAVEMRNLSYTYPGAAQPALRNINLTIAPGEKLAIVGINGGGKTTLAKAILGLLNLDQEGMLLYNGRPAEQYNSKSLHARMSCIFQDFSKYELPLAENVGVGEVTLMGDHAALKKAIGRAGAKGVQRAGPPNAILVPYKNDKRTFGGGETATTERYGGITPSDNVSPVIRTADTAETCEDTTPAQRTNGDDHSHQVNGAVSHQVGDTVDQAAAPPNDQAGPVSTMSESDSCTPTTEAASTVESDDVDTNSGSDWDSDSDSASDSDVDCTTESAAINGETATPVPVNGAADSQEQVASKDQKNGKDSEAAAAAHTATETTQKPKKSGKRSKIPTVGLSGGQWQRVALARAFMRAERADLVVFDEPSAALDPEAEVRLFNRIHSISATKNGKPPTATTVFISHRLSSVRRADKVAVMANGVSKGGDVVG